MSQSVQKSWQKYLVCVLLAGITCAAFASVATHPFIALDDREYIVGNKHIQQGFSWNSIKWAFTTYYASNWHPLTWLSHMLDFKFYGLNPVEPHLVNLALHITNTILLFSLLLNLTSKLWPSAFVAMLFGIHPMHVESVAWVAERKDMLSAFFFFLTLLAYARYVELANAKKSLAWIVYGFSIVLFALGLLSKPMLVTLPCILWLLDFWPLHRFQLPLKSQPRTILLHLLIEKIPFVLLAFFSSWITYFVQYSAGAVRRAALSSLHERLEHMPVAYVWYLFKAFWPVNLAVYYHLPYDVSSQDFVLPLFLLIAITVCAFLWSRKYPYFLVGWLWFLGMLVPVIGIVQVGNQAYADRYTYLPYIGLLIIMAWGIPQLVGKWPYRQAILCAGAILATILCFWRTIVEVGYWKNGQTLFERAIQVEPRDEMAWMLLGLEYENLGDNNQGIYYLSRATTIDDQFNLAWYNLGMALALKKDYPGAIDAYQSALSSAWFGLDKAKIYHEMGDAFMALNQYGQAITSYQNSIELFTNQPDLQMKLAQCFEHTGQPDQAATAYQNCINVNPNFIDAQLGMAMLMQNMGRDSEAIAHYQKVVALDTNVVIALNNLAWLLATDSDPNLRNGKEAVSLAEHACQQTHYQEAFFVGTLAAAYAETGEFDKAVAAAQKAHDVAMAHDQAGIADKNAQLMKIYKSGHAYHVKPETPPQKPSS